MGQYPIFTSTPVAMFKTRVGRSIIDYILSLKGMAKSDSFFIRASVPTNGTTYSQVAVDLGAYVDALGKSVLRIHNLEVQYGSGSDVVTPPTAGNANTTSFQLTTQSQTDIVGMDDKSVVATGKIQCNVYAAPGPLLFVDFLDVAPQSWTNGYLVGVEQMYLATDSVGGDLGIDAINIVMECTVETLSQSAAMALALSQQ